MPSLVINVTDQCNMTYILSRGRRKFIQKRNQRKSVLTYEQRVEIIKSLRYVDEVVPETDLDKIAAYRRYPFDVMFAGEDYLKEKLYMDATEELKKEGVNTIYIPRNRSVSSTSIRQKVVTLSQ